MKGEDSPVIAGFFACKRKTGLRGVAAKSVNDANKQVRTGKIT
jgi:hypothetical protein